MGVGHVSAGPVPQEREGDELPRRQHRGARASAFSLGRIGLARLGEQLAARFLIDRGAKVIGHNLRHGRGEVDLLASIEGVRVAVEVKTRTRNVDDPSEAFTPAKAAMVRRTAAQLDPPALRVDLVTVVVDESGVALRWIPEAG